MEVPPPMPILPIPAEWSPHRAMWVGWPSHGELWEDSLEPAQAEVEALVRALAGPGREQVKLMVGKQEVLAEAAMRFDGRRRRRGRTRALR